MRKTFAKAIIAILVLSNSALAQAESTVFPDLFLSNPNYQAITYLADHNVLNGYPDGSFRPNNDVNRAEFLKIIIGGSGIATDITDATPFPDVDHNAWYAPYLKKAYHEGWINGYPDGSFKPEQTINKVEALKILGEAQNWQLPGSVTSLPFTDTQINSWYAAYLKVAVNQEYLEENGPLYEPWGLMSRAKISEIIYRSILNPAEVSQNNDAATDDSSSTDNSTPAGDIVMEVTELPAPDPDISATNLNAQVIPSDFYSGITLNSGLPNIFYKNEVYIISGRVNSVDYDQATVLIDGTNNDNYNTFTGITTNRNFSIPVYFKQSGNYNIGILPGESGSTKAIPIAVMSELPTTSTGTSTPANNISIAFSNNQTSVSFTNPSSTIKRLNFSQGSRQISYLSRQEVSSIPISYPDFKYFNNSSINYNIETANISSPHPLTISSGFSKSPENSFIPTTHQFSDILITASPPETFPEPRTFAFSGTTNVDIFQNAYAIKTNGFVEDIFLETSSPTGTYLGQTTILAGGQFTYRYTTENTGTYILEINDSGGKPVLNHPLYIGSSVPALPDYFDLNTRDYFTGTLDLATERQKLLDLINQARQDHGLDPVLMDDDLNAIALAHTDDMAAKNYFGHVNEEGLTPDDRRIAAGIITAVSENIAKDVSVEQAHHGLMRSASHRENILTANWTKVGLGISLKDGLLYVGEEFSSDIASAEDLANFKNELEVEINIKRQVANVPELVPLTTLNDAAKFLVDQKIIYNTELSNELFTEALNTYNIFGSSTAIGRSFSLWDDILNSMLTEESSLSDPNWKSMGSNIQVDASGIIQVILLLNTQT